MDVGAAGREWRGDFGEEFARVMIVVLAMVGRCCGLVGVGEHDRCDVGERNGEMGWRLWEMFRVGRVSSAEDDVKRSKPEMDALERVLEGELAK